MAEDKGTMDQLITDVKQLRDELEVQLHLASADARDEFAELEKKWEQLRARAGVVGDAAGEAAGNVGEAVSSVADELKKGYQRIKGLL
jgi:ElaB/YqjD/DUF883 family membrane-anchored ribosome-binding protein